MSEKIHNNENIRDNDTLNGIINDAIQEVVDLFESQMTDRDKYMLNSVISEVGTSPDGRIVYLRQVKDSVGISPEIGSYVNQALQTIKQKFSPAEIQKCRAPFGGSLLDEIV